MGSPTESSGPSGAGQASRQKKETSGEAEQQQEEERLRAEVTDLRRAMESHPVIDRARGMLMALGPCTADEAWEVLVEVSQHTNIKLRQVAAELAATPEGGGATATGPSCPGRRTQTPAHRPRLTRPTRTTRLPRPPRAAPHPVEPVITAYTPKLICIRTQSHNTIRLASVALR
jgi:hypothetical protein